MSTATEEVVARENAGSSFPPHPEGQFAVRCIDLIDHGLVERTWKGKTKQQHRITLRFYAGEQVENDEGKVAPLWVDAWFTLSLNEKSALRPFLEAWRGQSFTAEELKGFNVAVLVGKDALIQVVHNRTPERTYANIKSVMRLPKGMPNAPPLTSYVRVKDRPVDTNGNGAAHDDADDDGLPF